MRLLKTTKPIPSWYLKSGKDNGSYDLEKLIWLPGNVRPVRKADVKASGLHRKQEVSPLVAPPVRRPVSDTPKVREGTGLPIPVKQPHVPPKLVIAR